MTWIKGLVLALFVLLLAIGGLIWEGSMPERLFSVDKVPVVDFRNLVRADTPNQYLVCANELCSAYIDELPPVYAATVAEVRVAWEAMLAREPRVTELRRDVKLGQFDYVQRSRIMRFPDLITVRFIPVDERRTTLAIYSRSVYGQGDMGVNKARIKDWISKLNGVLPLG